MAWATSMFTNEAKDLAENVDVKCMDGDDLKRWIEKWQVTWDDVYNNILAGLDRIIDNLNKRQK